MKKSEFERLVDKAFFELETRHGFKRTDTTFHKHGCTVRFQNATTLVILNYDITSLPWLEIADVKNPEQNKSTLGLAVGREGHRKIPHPRTGLPANQNGRKPTGSHSADKCRQLLAVWSGDLLEWRFLDACPNCRIAPENTTLACERYAKIHKTKKVRCTGFSARSSFKLDPENCAPAHAAAAALGWAASLQRHTAAQCTPRPTSRSKPSG